jgi:D-glycero-D-manno-heptose 1,7-bisphosphate phosphatase
MKQRKPAAAVFLDRDGTIIRDVGYLRRVDQLAVLARVPEALRLLRERGFKLVVVTNQSAIGRGWLSEDELAAIHNALNVELAHRGARLDAIYYCPHHPVEGIGEYRRSCSCRKPGRGMIDRAMVELAVNPTLSYVVGDQSTDIALARCVGAVPVLIRGPVSDDTEGAENVAVAADLWEAASWIIEHSQRHVRPAEAH